MRSQSLGLCLQWLLIFGCHISMNSCDSTSDQESTTTIAEIEGSGVQTTHRSESLAGDNIVRDGQGREENDGAQESVSSPAQSDIPVSTEIIEQQLDGNGCEAGSVVTNLSPDGDALTIVYSDLVATKEMEAESAMRDCVVNLTFLSSEPVIWQLERVDHRGFAFLADGVAADLQQAITLDRAEQTASMSIAGFFNDLFQWSITDQLPYSNFCLREHQFTVSLDIIVTGPLGTEGLVAIDSTDANWQSRLGLSPVKCSQK
jgi:hypothetical protein